MFDWFRNELKLIGTPKFHQCRKDDVVPHESTIDWPVEPPEDYRRFIEEFGSCSLYRLRSYWEITVNDRPVVIDDAKKGRFLKFGGKDPGIACFKLEEMKRGEARVYETRGVSGLFCTHDSFAGWLEKTAARVRRSIKKQNWARIVAGPNPFTEAEWQLVSLRRLYSWKLIHATPKGELEFEVTNGSTSRLDFLSIGISAGTIDTRISLRVDGVAPGETGRVKGSLWHGYHNEKDAIAAFTLPDPGPEDREYYSEFQNVEAAAAARSKAADASLIALRLRYKNAVGSVDSLDPSERMSAAMRLVSEGRDSEALTHYLWCFDHGVEQRPAWVGVRSSFLLGHIWELGHDLGYAPALSAMRERRDACFSRMEHGMETSADISDFASLNRALREQRRTLQALDASPRGSAQWMTLAQHLRKYLFKARRFSDLLLAYPPEETISNFTASLKLACGGIRGHLEDMFLRQAYELIEALVAVGEPTRAATLCNEILKALPGRSIHSTLIGLAAKWNAPPINTVLEAHTPTYRRREKG